MNRFKLQSDFKPTGDQPQAIAKLFHGLNSGFKFQTLLGVTGSGKTFTVANIIEKFQKPTLVIAPNKSLAAQLYREYKNFFPNNSVHYFVSYYDYYQPEAYMPNSDTYIDKEATINEEIDRFRHSATSALSERSDVIVVASVSCIYNLGVPINYFESAIKLTLGQTISRADLISQLVKIQFKRTNNIISRSQFRVRGDIFELIPASGEYMVKIELSNQEVSAISFHDPLTLKIIEKLSEIAIFPTKHFVSTQPEIEDAVKNIDAELKDRIKYFRSKKLYLEEERIKRRTKYDMEMLGSLGFCHGIENYSRHLTGKLSGEAPYTLLSYFKDKDFLLIIDESHISVPQIRGMYEGDKSRKETLIKYGWRLPSALDNRPLKFNEFLNSINQTIFTSATPGNFENDNSSKTVKQVIRPTGLIDPPIEIKKIYDAKNNFSQVDDFKEQISLVVKENNRAIANVLTKKMAEDLAEFLAKNNFKVKYLHSDIGTFERSQILTDFRTGVFDILVGVNLLREGLDLPEVALVAIFDADKEGFLRSESSLIQTMGRASRNVSGRVILYADKITGSIERAVKIVNDRRIKQLAYNKKHNITAQSIIKKIENLIEEEETDQEVIKI